MTEELAAPKTERAVETLRSRLAGRAAREHALLDFLDEDLAQARAALSALASYVASVEAALSYEEPSRQELLSLALGGAPVARVEGLGAALGSARRRLAQVAARL